MAERLERPRDARVQHLGLRLAPGQFLFGSHPDTKLHFRPGEPASHNPGDSQSVAGPGGRRLTRLTSVV
jgi:hypothetical protein